MKTARTLIATYDNFLGSLDGWLSKAEDDPRGDALLGHRLADDMHPLARQIRFVCNLPGEAMARAAGVAFTPSDEDDPTLSAARARVSAARDRVREWHDVSFPADDSPVELALPNGMTFDLDIETYARDWALAQFYFHLMTAYAILRAAGVPLGKADYVGFMLQHMRPPAVLDQD